MTATAITSLGEVTEVPEKARRRTYTVECKLKIVKEADACKGSVLHLGGLELISAHSKEEGGS